MPGYFFLQHPAILEDRRRKLRPDPPPSVVNPLDIGKPKDPEDLIPIPPPKKIKNVVRKRDKKIEIEIKEPPVDEPVVVTKRRTVTIKKNAKPLIKESADVDDPVVDITKRISTLGKKPENNLRNSIDNNDTPTQTSQ